MQEYIENVLDPPAFDISFLTWRTNLNENIWQKKNVKVYTLINDDEPKIINIFKLIFRFLDIRQKLGKPDIIHYHFIDHRFTLLTDFFIGRSAKNTILSFWGSDLLRQKNKTILSFSHIFKRAKKINVMNKEMFDKFQEVTKGIYSSKLFSLDFGDSTLDALINADKQYTRCEIKKRWSIPSNKICVHLGYNGFEAQQHLRMINSLSNCKDSIKKKIYITIPFSYGCPNAEYKNQIINCLNDAGIDFMIQDQFLDKEDVGAFRLTADIFLYGQTTDAVSASMIEYFAAGATVIKAEWLIYSELTEAGIEMVEYTNFENLTNIFEKIIENQEYKKINLQKNRKIVMSLKSWSVLKNKWLEMYI